MRQYQSQNWVDAGWVDGKNPEFIKVIAAFEHGDPLDGMISLKEFAKLAGIGLSDDIYKTSYGQHLKDSLIMEGIFSVPEEILPFFELGNDEDQDEE